MRTALLLLCALASGVAVSESYDSNSAAAIEAAVTKDPARAIQLIDKQLAAVESDLNALYKRNNGFSPKDWEEQDQGLGAWQDWLTTMRKKAENRLGATRRDQDRIPAGGVMGASVSR